MNDFDNYNPKKWLDNGLSRHPKLGTKKNGQLRNGSSQLTQFILPLVAAASIFVMQNTVSSQDVVVDGSVNAIELSHVHAQPVYWLGTAASGLAHASPISAFEEQVGVIARQLAVGLLTNVSSETLGCARAMLGRAANRATPSDAAAWMSDVARAVAQFTD